LSLSKFFGRGEMGEKILIVEDEEDLRAVMKSALEKENYEVLEAEDSEAAFGIGRHEIPDLIIIDVILDKSPEDGFELAKKLKEDPLTKEIPLVFCSIRDRKEDILRAYQLGALEYIVKPLSNLDVLVDCVRKVLEGKISQEEVEKKKARLEVEVKLFPSESEAPPR
jgi:DNA-binding response OmpR family regulator